MADDERVAALEARVAHLEDFSTRLAGLLGAAGKVLDMGNLVEREYLHGDRTPQAGSRPHERRAWRRSARSDGG
jgi:hypothetical protein